MGTGNSQSRLVRAEVEAVRFLEEEADPERAHGAHHCLPVPPGADRVFSETFRRVVGSRSHRPGTFRIGVLLLRGSGRFWDKGERGREVS